MSLAVRFSNSVKRPAVTKSAQESRHVVSHHCVRHADLRHRHPVRGGHLQAVAPAQAGPLSRLWSALTDSERIIFLSGRDAAPSAEEIATLWATCFDRPELLTSAGVQKVATAIQHSFTVQFVFCEDGDTRHPAVDGARSRKLIGTARTISDGHFAAQVLDVCVHPEFRGRGIGVALMNNICTETRASGPRSIAVFVGPVRPAHAPMQLDTSISIAAMYHVCLRLHEMASCLLCCRGAACCMHACSSRKVIQRRFKHAAHCAIWCNLYLQV